MALVFAAVGRSGWLTAVLLVLWAAGWAVYDARTFGVLLSWHFFVAGARRLIGLGYPRYTLPGGLHLFASYPRLQIGPLAFVAALPLAVLPRLVGQVLAAALMLGAGALVAWLSVDATIRVSGTAPRRSALMVVFLCAAPLWVNLAFAFGHLDDVLALTLMVVAVNTSVRGRYQLSAVALGLSAAAKPWAVAFLPLVLMAPRSQWRKVASEAIGLAVLGWVPFVAADPHTLRAATFKIRVASASVLSLFGVTGGTPPWVRPVQFAAGAALVAVCVLTGRYAGAVATAIALRLGVDPNTYPYYTAGLLISAALWDFLASTFAVPVMTVACFLALYLPTLVHAPAEELGALRLALVLTVPLLVMRRPRDRFARARSSSAPSTHPSVVGPTRFT